MKQLDEKQKQLDETYFVESNKNYIDNGETKKEVFQLNDEKTNTDEIANNDITHVGASTEAEVTKAAAANKNYTDAVSRLAKAGLKKKETLYKEYKKKSESIADKKANLQLKKKTLFNQMF